MFLRYLICLTIISFCLADIEPLCRWHGYAPFCFIGNSCPENCSQLQRSDRGDGATCWFGMKSYCCCLKKTVDSIINTLVDGRK